MSEPILGAIAITGKDGWSSCECCGSYGWEHYTILKDGKAVLDHMGDGHLGGGEWLDWQHAITDILTALGYTVSIDIEHCGGAA